MNSEPPEKDHSAGVLLDLDGVTFFVDPDESYRVKFEIMQGDRVRQAMRPVFRCIDAPDLEFDPI